MIFCDFCYIYFNYSLDLDIGCIKQVKNLVLKHDLEKRSDFLNDCLY